MKNVVKSGYVFGQLDYVAFWLATYVMFSW